MSAIHVDEFGRVRHEMDRPVSFKRLRIGGGSGGRYNRKHPELSVGQKLGPWRVVTVLGRGYQGRADLRALVECTCGRQHAGFEYNLRKLGAHPSCQHGQGLRRRERAR